MILYSMKLNGNKIIKYIFFIILIISFIMLSFGIYQIFFKKQNPEGQSTFMLTDTINKDKIYEITTHNYTSILQAVNSDIDSYIGCKIHFTGYIYRLIDFNSDEFVLARNMLVNKDATQSLVVGFFCTSENASDFSDGTWVDVTGTIVKGNYYGDIAQIKISNMFECNEPEDKYVVPPDNTYIPTSNIL